MSNLRQNEPPAERCWKGAGAHLKPKNLKLEDSKTDETPTSTNEVPNKQTNNFYIEKPKKLDLPRLQFNEKLHVRQYIISDPSNIYYTEYCTYLKETSSAD